LELLVVVAILAMLGGALLVAYQDVDEDAAFKVVQQEILKIKEAVLRFKQDSGFLPKQGPFELASPNAPCVATNPNGVAPLPAGQTRDWYCAPGNFYQLYENPLAGTGHPLETWNPDTGRGWRGPYLTRHGEGLVDIGDGLNPDGTGSPIAGAVLSEVRGVADPFVGDPVGPYLVWRTTPGSAPHQRWGRPYFLFDLNSANARIVAMGRNKTYDGASGDDIALDLLK